MIPFNITIFFYANLLLVLIDATISYFAAPVLAAQFDADEEGAAERINKIRRTVSLMVTINSAATCAAYYWESITWLVVIGFIMLFDIGIALYFVTTNKVKQ